MGKDQKHFERNCSSRCICENCSKNRQEFRFRIWNGTLFEDLVIVNQLQETFPTYKEKFPIWAQQTSAMHQLVIWSMLEEAGFGVSLQHYNPLIDEMVQQEWQISSSWELVAQMPFGIPVSPPDSKESKAVGDRVLVFE